MSTVSNPGPLDQPRRRLGDKSIWNWLDMLAKLAIPLILGIATILFSILQANFAAQQQKQQQDLAAQQQKQQQASALDQQNAVILQTYIDNIQDLLINHNLSKSKPEDEIRQVAREQTITTLQRLDAHRNGIVLRFLQDAHLIGPQDAVINLSNADLSKDQLDGIDLSGIDLIGADLSGADLNGADLSSAILYGANLSGATLDCVLLSGATPHCADLSNAQLSDATLTGATLSGATLSGADLTGAFLSGATLNGVLLSGATLSGADLSGATLSGATLSGADLSGADLNGATNLTQQQLDKVILCTNAILQSTGLTCHHRGSSKVTLTYWYTETTAEQPVIKSLIQQFQQQYPNIIIKAMPKPFFQTQAAFITAAQAGNPPDVLRSDIGWVTQFASQHYLLNIDSYISQSDLSDYMSVPLSFDKYNGHLYGLPQVTDFLALLYNKSELEIAGITPPPATMDDFEADAKKVVQSEAPTYGFETNGSSYFALPFLSAFGGGMFDQHNNILVNNSYSVKGLTFLLKLQNKDKVMPTDVNFSKGSNNMIDDFMNGKTAMIFDGPSDVLNILQNGSAFKGYPGNLGIAAIPTGPSGQTGSPVGGQSYVISAHTAHPAEAYKFISFMSQTSSQVAIAHANHTLPTRQSAYQNPVVSSDAFISAFLSIQHTAVARPVIPQNGLLFFVFDPNIQAALDGVKSPPDALNAVYDAWKQLMAGP